MTERQVPRIFSTNRKRLARVRARDPDLYGRATYAIDRKLAEDIDERIGFLNHRPARIFHDGIGMGSLGFARSITPAPQWTANLERDLDEPLPYAPASFDLVTSIGTLDSVNDLPGALIQMRELLAPGGLAIACFVGGRSLTALRTAMMAADQDRPAARMHPLIDIRACPQLLQRAGWASPVVDSYTFTARYHSLDELVTDLRAYGWNNVLTSAPPALTKAGAARARAAFLAQADADGQVAETFEIITLTGWRAGPRLSP